MRGFTLLELLIVIGIGAVLAVATVLVLNPAELLRQGRDARRLSDFALLGRVLGIGRALPSSDFVYVSLPDDDPGCASQALPPLVPGRTYRCVPSGSVAAPDGSGWIPQAFVIPGGAGGLPQLPVDPVNDDGLYYAYWTASSTWKLSLPMESEKFRERAARDGGTDPIRLEQGSGLEEPFPLAP